MRPCNVATSTHSQHCSKAIWQTGGFPINLTGGVCCEHGPIVELFGLAVLFWFCWCSVRELGLWADRARIANTARKPAFSKGDLHEPPYVSFTSWHLVRDTPLLLV